MSVDPSQLAAGAGGAAAAIDALITAELNALAADAQALQAQLAVGDTATATVLPSNGLTDLISIEGYRVAASLPPNLHPGDQITVRVASYTDTNQVVLQIVAASEEPVPPANVIGVPGSPAPPPGLTGSAPPPAATPAPAQAPVPSTLAPPSAVFVAASVRPNAPVPPPVAGGGFEPNAPSAPIPGAAGTAPAPPIALAGIEARLAAARAAAVTVAAPLAPPPATSGPTAPGPAPAALPDAAASLPSPARPAPPPAGDLPLPVAPGSTRGFVIPPPIAPRLAAAPAPGTTAQAAPASAAPAAAATPAAYTDPVNLVRALRLPVTPTNLAAARLALESPQRLPAALATLESALPQTDDPRVATYRAIVGFIGRIDPQSPQLATQLAAYVEHVVGGSEPVVAQLTAAHLAADAPDAPLPNAPGAQPPAAAAETLPDAPTAPTPPEAPSAPAAEAPTLPALALAQIVERSARLASHLKEQLFSLVAEVPATASEVVAPAATGALTAVTAVQLNAAQAALSTPGALSFAIPLAVGGSFAQAQLTVDRDAPDAPSVPLDGDNFHIAFVLDTKHLGTVAIDLRTVGRQYALSVKAETLRAAERFGDELSRLTDRLGSLRYQAASVEAVVAAPEVATSTITRSVVETNDDGNWTARA